MKKLPAVLLCAAVTALIVYAAVYIAQGQRKYQNIETVLDEADKKEPEEAAEGTKESLAQESGRSAAVTQFYITEEIPDTDDPANAQESETAAQRTEPIVLTFAGDILLDDSYAVMASMLERGSGDKESILLNSIDDELVDIMRSADIFMLNNEFPYTLRGEPLAGKKFTFRAKPESAELLRDIGVDIVSLANNHAYDYGEISLLDTLDTLEEMEMPYVGAGRNIEEASRTIYFDIDGVRIAYISATQIERSSPPDTRGATDTAPGTFRCNDDELLLKRISEAALESDFVAVYVHWGTEGTSGTDYLQEELAPKIARAGADLIIGDHPHVLQGIDYIDDVPVFYSLGNYLFNSKTLDTCLVSVGLDPVTKTLTYLKFIPALQTGCRVRYLEGAEKQRVIDVINSISRGAAADADGFISKK